MNLEELIQNLESHWNTGGFLDAVRRGEFDANSGHSFVALLRGIAISEHELIPKRLLSLLWYLPLFLEWQKERIAEANSSNTVSYEDFVTEVQNVLEEVLGVP
ncbi:MAG TPA: hypothetical protein DDZ51_02145 [Planctomycetaceae bacterium]|nr:hypothetical protein [Planctomycetaceae bacterium]